MSGIITENISSRQNGKGRKKKFAEIEKFLKELSHDLNKIYEESVVGEKFLKRSNIVEVKAVINSGVFNYVFSIEGFNNPIQVYRAESIKYGLMTGVLSNLGFVAWQTDVFLEMVKNIFEVSISSTRDGLESRS